MSGWDACQGTRLREVHVNDNITIRLNDTQLEARSPAGAWLPLTLSLIPRPYRLALADLLRNPIEEVPRPQHSPACRIRTGGVCTCTVPALPEVVGFTSEITFPGTLSAGVPEDVRSKDGRPV